jgi:2-iminobutanoate/2-iminopropanoate deaminase
MNHAIKSLVLPKPHFLYSPALVIGENIMLSGMVALVPSTGELEQTDVAGQTKRILKNLCAFLTEQNLQTSDVILARIYTTEFESFKQINQVWEEIFNAVEVPPLRTSMGVSALPLGAKVEMEFMCRGGNNELIK